MYSAAGMPQRERDIFARSVIPRASARYFLLRAGVRNARGTGITRTIASVDGSGVRKVWVYWSSLGFNRVVWPLFRSAM